MKYKFTIPSAISALLLALVLAVGVVGRLAAQGFDHSDGTFIMSTYLLDQDRNLTADDIPALLDQFGPPSGIEIDGDGSVLWIRTEIPNPTEFMDPQIILFYHAVDSVEVYSTTEAGMLQLEYIKPVRDERQGPGFQSRYSLGVEPGRSVTVYSRLQLAETAADFDLARILLINLDDITWVIYTVWDAFYTGLVLSMALLGLLMIYLFRDRTFLYFSISMVGWAIYFQFAGLLLDLNGAAPITHSRFLAFPFGVSIVASAITLFSLYYLKLNVVAPKTHRNFIALLLISLAALWAPWVAGFATRDAMFWSNVSLLAFIILGMAMLIGCQLRGVEGSNRLHFALAFIVIPAVVQTVQILLGYGVHMYNSVSIQIGSVLFSWLLFFGLYTRVKQMRTEAASISQESRIRSRFFANISHEFRTPLTLILGPLEQLARRHAEDPVDHQLITVAQRNAQRQLELVNRILTLSRLEERKDDLQLEQIDLVPSLFRVYESFLHLAEEKDIDLTFTPAVSELPMLADAEKVEDIVFNLLSNAVKFTPSGGRVGVEISRVGTCARIRIHDDGPGIPEDLHGYIFNRFAQLPKSPHTDIPGTGIGLAIVRESVLLHDGTIDLQSAAGEGSSFVIDLPIGEVDVAGAGVPDKAVRPPASESLPAPAKLERVLVVEDNADLRLLLRYLLEESYEVLEAGAGRAGLEIATRQSPDLIISDVMMPGMDGIELCAKLKSQAETSHIPVVLLTARGSTDSRIKGLETGADDYLTKPFSNQELLARIHSLLENRKLLRRRYAESIELKPTEVASNKVDERFLENALGIVEKHIDDENFRVASFAREIGMSSATLNRKLRGLLDQSTNQFIQSIRLQRAADLLAGGEYTVGEVAARCGFNSSTYFVRLFKEKYGVTPGSFQRD